MPGYLLNLTFDLQSSGSATGLFNDNSSTQPDATSKVWYPIAANWPPNGNPLPGTQLNAPIFLGFPPSGGQPDSGGLPCSYTSDIYIRIAARTWGNNGPTAINFWAAFGRSDPTLATLASPFLLNNRLPKTLFYLSNCVAYQGSWIFYLGKPGQPGNPPNSPTGSYEFIVGAAAWDGNNNSVEYGHDPKIVISGGGGF